MDEAVVKIDRTALNDKKSLILPVLSLDYLINHLKLFINQHNTVINNR